MLQVAHALHGRVPTLVAEEVEGDELEAGDVGAVAGQGVPHLVGPLEASNRAADSVSLPKQFERDVARSEANAGG